MRFFLRLGPSASEVASHKAVSDLATVLLTAMQKLSLGDEKKAVVSEKEPELKPHAQEVRAAGDEKERSEAETIPADLPLQTTSLQQFQKRCRTSRGPVPVSRT